MNKLIICMIVMLFIMATYSRSHSEELWNTYEFVSSSINVSDNWLLNEDDLYIWRTPWKYRGVMLQASQEFDIPYKYIYRLIYIESKFNDKAIRYENNGSVSIGCMQLNTGSLQYFSDKFNNGNDIDPFDKYQSIYVGCAYLKYLYTEFDNDWLSAFVAYNWGPGNFKLGRKIPRMTIDYSFSVYYGDLYLDYVEEIKGAVFGIV